MLAALRIPLAAAALLLAFGVVSAAPLVALACPMATPPIADTQPPCHGDADDVPDAPMLCCVAAPAVVSPPNAPSALPQVPVAAHVGSFLDMPTVPLAVRYDEVAIASALPPSQSSHLTTRLLI